MVVPPPVDVVQVVVVVVAIDPVMVVQVSVELVAVVTVVQPAVAKFPAVKLPRIGASAIRVAQSNGDDEA